MNRIAILNETIKITNERYYTINGNQVVLKHPITDLKDALYLSEKDVLKIMDEQKQQRRYNSGINCIIKVSNRDTLGVALNMNRQVSEGEMAVLNFANPVNPGGGVRYGTVAQEEYL